MAKPAVVAFALLALSFVAPAWAQPQLTPDERAAQARQFYETGMASFQLEEYDRAIEAWEAGFRIKPVPQFLYNIAQAHRLAKRYEKALSFYRKYLNMEPRAENRVEVERHIATLVRLVEDQRKASNAPPTAPLVAVKPDPNRPPPTVTPPPPEPKAVTPPPEPKVVTTPPPTPPPAGADVSKHAADTRPVYKKGWFWGVIGGVAVVVVAGVVIGVVVGTADNTKVLPGVRF